MSKVKKEKEHHEGHRQRLRERFSRGGADALQLYELIELVLFRNIPRRDVKPVAKNLLAAFGGDISTLLAASEKDLRAIDGISENTAIDIKVIEAIALKFGQSRIMNRIIISAWDDLIRYLRMKFAELTTEQFHVVFLDSKNQIIDDHTVARGGINHVPIEIRELMKTAMNKDAAALIIAHNHPSGDPKPSKADISMTKKIKETAASLGITLHDHIIIGKTGEYSFRNEGHL